MIISHIARSIFAALLLQFSASAQEKPNPYLAWQHSGALTILTTPEGADIPAGAVVEGFPLLVRLSGDWFDFKQAKADGVKTKVEAMTARLFAPLREHFQRRYRLRFLISYPRSSCTR